MKSKHQFAQSAGVGGCKAGTDGIDELGRQRSRFVVNLNFLGRFGHPHPNCFRQAVNAKLAGLARQQESAMRKIEKTERPVVNVSKAIFKPFVIDGKTIAMLAVFVRSAERN